MTAVILLDKVTTSTTSAWKKVTADGSVILLSPNSQQLAKKGSVEIQVRSGDGSEPCTIESHSSYYNFPFSTINMKSGMSIRAVYKAEGSGEFTLEAVGDF